jgi:hypothetical protein
MAKVPGTNSNAVHIIPREHTDVRMEQARFEFLETRINIDNVIRNINNPMQMTPTRHNTSRNRSGTDIKP